MHLRGINTRYLGYLYNLLRNNEEMKVLVLTEAVARVLKHEMEERYNKNRSFFFFHIERWRNMNSLKDEDYTLALMEFINFVFGDSYEGITRFM